MKRFYAFLAKYVPDANKADGSVVYGYGEAQTLAEVLKQAGDNLTRQNIMKQAANLKDFVPDSFCRASRSTPARPTSIRSSSCR